MEPQIPGMLSGMPAEGNPAQVLGATTPGYVEGPTPNMAPTVPTGNPTVNPIVPQQRPMRISGEWRW